jgi:hypothetical protein
MDMSIVEMTRQTGKNLADFITHIAAHIEKLENENAELRRELELRNTDGSENREGSQSL